MHMKHFSQGKLLTPVELAALVITFREIKGWSQDTLASCSRLNVRTIQRVEKGDASSSDTRRALAEALGYEDINVFNKPLSIPSAEELKIAEEKFSREYITLNVHPLITGKQLTTLAESCVGDTSSLACTATPEADKAFAALVDYFREYRDIADFLSETQKIEVNEEMQTYIDTLKKVNICLRYGTTKINPKFAEEQKPIPRNILYVIGFSLGKELEQVLIPKNAVTLF